MKKLIFFLISVSLFLQSCATMLQGSRQTVVVTCEPAFAKIYINEEHIGNGYASKKLRRNKTHKIMVVHDDYNTFYAPISNHVQPGWIITDILCGFIPFVVDLSTGAWRKFYNNQYQIKLEKK